MIRLRIVGGRLRGRALARPQDLAIRPTSDRTREAVFNILAHGAAAVSLDGVRVIDLFAGTGALGIEAISRGAAYALFVDESAEARGLIRENVEALGLTGCTRIFRRDATDLGPASQLGQFGLAFLDPPYSKLLGDQALASLLAGGWLAPGAVVVLEEREGVSVAVPAGLQAIEQRSYGDTQVMFLRAS
jgi:16S rRNA (guanine966-N2)-methyltransferase